MSPDALFELELADGRKLIVRASAITALCETETPNTSRLVVNGAEFRVVGGVEDLAQALVE